MGEELAQVSETLEAHANFSLGACAICFLLLFFSGWPCNCKATLLTASRASVLQNRALATARARFGLYAFCFSEACCVAGGLCKGQLQTYKLQIAFWPQRRGD